MASVAPQLSAMLDGFRRQESNNVARNGCAAIQDDPANLKAVMMSAVMPGCACLKASNWGHPKTLDEEQGVVLAAYCSWCFWRHHQTEFTEA